MYSIRKVEYLDAVVTRPVTQKWKHTGTSQFLSVIFEEFEESFAVVAAEG